MSVLKLTSLYLLRDVQGPARASHELVARYQKNRGVVAAETAREARRLGIEAEEAVRNGWRPRASAKGKSK